MGKIKTSPAHNKKKTSKFQQLWQRAEDLKQELSQREQRLDALAKRVEREIYPAELAAAQAQKPLLFKLLELGQRKSWANWERQELERWIGEKISLLGHFSLIDEPLKDAISRYDAFRIGVELDEDDGAPLSEQLSRILDEREAAEQQEEQELEAEFSNHRDAFIAKFLDEQLGPRPPSKEAEPTPDLFADETPEDTPEQVEYDRLRAELKLEFEASFSVTLDEMFGDPDGLSDDEKRDEEQAEAFDREFFAEQNPANPKLDGNTIKRLFRSTAAVLHPDREPDPEKRLLKQSLMAQLLLAENRAM